jgi:plastocyanin
MIPATGSPPAGPSVGVARDLWPSSRARVLAHDGVVSRSREARQARERRRRLQRRGAIIAAAALVALAGVVLLPISDDGADGGSALDPVPVSMVEYAFEPSDIHASPGQELAVTNDGAITHNLLIVSLGKGVELPAGGSGSLEVPSADPGTYQIVCDLPGHTEAGMVGTLVID